MVIVYCLKHHKMLNLPYFGIDLYPGQVPYESLLSTNYQQNTPSCLIVVTSINQPYFIANLLQKSTTRHRLNTFSFQ